MQFELAQESVKKIESDFYTTDKFKKICQQVITEGSVLLENDGVLPILNKKIALFGRCQINTFYAGYGSGGDVKSPYKVSLLDGLIKHKAILNEDLMNKYLDWTKENVPDEGYWGNWPLCFLEMPISKDYAKAISETSDVAIVIIGRSAGEDRDILKTKGSWYLTDEEKELLNTIRSTFDKLVILINSGSIMDITEILNYKPNALMYIWQGGQEMGNGVAEILLGEASPCGKLTDTIAKIESYPSTSNFGNPDYALYEEDIYVGYRYFNTFKEKDIIYPFGYGLTYSKFLYDVLEVCINKTIINCKVVVKNVGNYPSKEVLELYISKPNGKLGNPKIELASYKKTNLLNPNEQQILDVSFDLKSICSYDDTGITGYINHFVLENGLYSLYLGFDSININKAYEFNIDNTIIIKKTQEACAPIKPFKRIVNNNGITYNDVPLKTIDTKQRILNYLPDNNQVDLDEYLYTYDDLKKGKITIDKFVNTLDLFELEALTRGSLYSMNSPYGPSGNAGTFGGSNEKLFKRGIPAISTNDGPSGVRLAVNSTQVPNGVMLASTFNDELIELLGYEIGKEVKERSSHVLLAPGLNIHRSPLCGRNFEYYSEDPLLSGMMASAYVRGVQKAGVSACPKHFACNNQEFNRHINDSRLSQRALREIYLRGFEICIKESRPNVIMTSYNFINGEYSYYSHDLVRIILKEEMEYAGLVITDWWMKDGSSPYFEYMTNQAYRVRAGVDVFMPGAKIHNGEGGESDGSIISSFVASSLKVAELRYCVKNVINFILNNIK